MAEMVVGYVLAKTVLRVRAERFEVVDHLRGTTQKISEPTFELVTIGDPHPNAAKEVTVPVSGGDASTAVVLRADRRLASFEAAVEGRGPARVAAGLKLGGAVVGALLSVVAPPLAGGLTLAAAAAAGAGAAPSGFRAAKGPSRETIAPPEAEEGPIVAAYRRDHPREADLLVTYRRAIAGLMDAHAGAALEGDLERLRTTSKALSSARRQAGIVEEHFAAWQVDEVTKTSLGLHHEEADLRTLPSAADVLKAFGDLDHPASERALHDRRERWVEWGKHLGMTISVDWLPGQVDPPDSGAFRDEIRVEYRPGRLATVTTWRVAYEPSRRVKDAGGNEHREPPRYRATRTAVTTLRLVPDDADTVKLSLDAGAWRKGTLKLAFNELGEPSEIGGSAEGLVEGAVEGAVGAVKDGIDAGGGLATALVPGSMQLAALERRLAISKARAELKDLLAAPDPPADGADPMAELQAEVTLAELEARLVAARTASNALVPTSVVYVGGAIG